MADKYIGELDALGAALVVTADHGMKPKHDANGKPSVIYVQDILDQWLGQAAARVILPITDPYVFIMCHLARLQLRIAGGTPKKNQEW